MAVVPPSEPRKPPPPRGRAKSDDPRHELGRLGESLACEHFERLGFRVLDRNVRSRSGEIDLIAFDGRTLVFVEVKTRRVRPQTREHSSETPLCGLRPQQRARVRRAAVAWLCDPQRPRPSARALRLDAVGVTVDAAGRLLRLDHIEGAW